MLSMKTEKKRFSLVMLVYEENQEVNLVVIDSSVSPPMIVLERWEIPLMVDHDYRYPMFHVVKIRRMIMVAEVQEVSDVEQVMRMTR